MRKTLFLEVITLLALVACNKQLQWSEKAPNAMDWNNAKRYCSNLSEGGFADWRLPNIDELRTLVQNHPGTQTGGTCQISEKVGKLSLRDWTGDCYGKNGNHFSKLGDIDWVWSSSSNSDSSNAAWYVDFRSGSVFFYDKWNHYDVRCVR